jgi:hypothetical protein
LLLPGVSRVGHIEAQGEIIAGKWQAGRQAAEAKEGRQAMSVYKRGEVWWYKFRFNGQVIRESANTGSKTLAREAERIRRQESEEGLNGIRRQRARLFSLAAQEWLDLKRSVLSPRSVEIQKANLKHLGPQFDGKLIGDIEAADISRYHWQQPASVYYLTNRQRECILPFSLKNWPRAAQFGPGSRSTVGFRIITTTLEVQFFPARERSPAFQKARRNVVS